MNTRTHRLRDERGNAMVITLMILLSRQGDLVLLDEPTVNLDRNLRRRFIDFLNAEILPSRDNTVLMASHDLDFIQALRLVLGVSAAKKRL